MAVRAQSISLNSKREERRVMMQLARLPRSKRKRRNELLHLLDKPGIDLAFHVCIFCCQINFDSEIDCALL